MKTIKEKNRKKADGSKNIIDHIDNEKEMFLFHENRKTIKELVAPNGVNPNPLDYMIIDDNGIPLYTMCFYIHKLPTTAKFASTFAGLFNFPNTTSTVFIEPMVDGKSTKQLDKRVLMLDTERVGAEKERDRNKLRKIMSKLNDAENWAKEIESGDNILFEVAFLFTIQSEELENLRLKASDLHMRAREKGIELAACYSVHPEAFVSGYPTNRIFNSTGPIKTNIIKKHVLDKGALSTIFNHTRSSFSHKHGIIAGRNMFTGQPITFDIYDPSHMAYGLIICGSTGTGKSATIKMYSSRYIDFGYKIRSIDFEARGTMGEYAMMATKLGGVNFQIKANSKNIINLFEIDEEEEFDEMTGTEYPVLNLISKISDLKNIIMIMIKNGREIHDFAESTFIERIVADTIAALYNDRGIYDQQVDSLYNFDSAQIVNGQLTSGKVKKELPTITDFYKKILVEQSKNLKANNHRVNFYAMPYQIIIDSMRDYVKELNYCPECLRFYSPAEYRNLNSNNEGNKVCNCDKKNVIVEVRGAKAYYDGQSTVKANADTPHINIDISQLPECDKMIALLIALNYMQENYIKKNSINPKKIKKLVVLIDELHKTFHHAEARKFISDVYRTARKRNVSPWTATQALADFKGYPETEGIIKNSTSILLLKQNFQDREFIKESTPLTDSEVEQVLSLGGDPTDMEEQKSRKGEVCLIDNQRVVFLRVDYLTESEALIVETDSNKIRQMYKGELNT